MSITGLPCGPGLCPERTISGNIYLNYNNDLYYITGNNTISSLVYVSNSTNINLYNGYYNIFNYYTNALLSISSILFTSTTNYNSCLNGMQSLNNISYPNGATVYNNIYIPQYTYSIDPVNSFDASGNYTSYITTTSSYKTASNVSSVSGVIYNDLSGLYFGLNILNNYQDLYNSSYSTYINVLNQLQLITNNMMTISNNIYLNKNTLYPVNAPIYNSLNSILNDKQNQLNSLSSFINNSTQILQNQINNVYTASGFIASNNILQNQINTLSGVLYNVAINNTFNNLYATSYNDKASVASFTFTNGIPYLYNDFYKISNRREFSYIYQFK